MTHRRRKTHADRRREAKLSAESSASDSGAEGRWPCYPFWTASIRLPATTTRAGSFRPPRSRFTCRSVRRTRSACSISRCRKLVGITDVRADRLEAQHSRLGVQRRDRFSRAVGRCLRRMARARRAAPRDVRVGGLLRRRLSGRRARRRAAPVLARAARLWRDRRHRARTRLHLARLDAHQVVSRPPGHGHRNGDHGIWRRRDDRVAAVDDAHGALQDADVAGRRRDVRRDGTALSRIHDVRRVQRSRAEARLAAGGLDAMRHRRRR